MQQDEVMWWCSILPIEIIIVAWCKTFWISMFIFDYSFQFQSNEHQTWSSWLIISLNFHPKKTLRINNVMKWERKYLYETGEIKLRSCDTALMRSSLVCLQYVSVCCASTGVSREWQCEGCDRGHFGLWKLHERWEQNQRTGGWVRTGDSS